jgi:hypothetical protein
MPKLEGIKRVLVIGSGPIIMLSLIMPERRRAAL